jgi:hypothetical protein
VAFLGPARDAYSASTLDLRDLPNDRARRAGRAGSAHHPALESARRGRVEVSYFVQITARIVGGTRGFGVRLVSGDGVAVAGKRWPPRSQRGGGRRLLFGDYGLTHAFENRLKLGQICRVVAPRRPGGADAGDGVGRVESEASLDGGIRLIKSTELREGGRQ